MDLRIDDLRTAFGFGVAGNFAGHLEQAGEAGDFVSVQAEPEAPKGIFPWYAPGSGTFLETFPLSADTIAWPADADGPVNLQIEPEVGLVCDVSYAVDGRVAAVGPRALAAFNDCSIRREGAPKISHKKNWGPASKGLATTAMPVREIDPEGATSTLRLASFLVRDGATHAYGVDSPLPGYSYYGERLLDWIADRLNEQRGAPDTPLEDVGALLRGAGNPPTVVIGIGATRYTDLGATTYLQPGDESVVVVYDGAVLTAEQVADAVSAGEAVGSTLRQRVVA